MYKTHHLFALKYSIHKHLFMFQYQTLSHHQLVSLQNQVVLSLSLTLTYSNAQTLTRMNHQPNYDTLQGNGNIFGKFHSTSSKLALIAAMSLVLLTTVPLYYPSLITYYPLLSSTRTTTSSSNSSYNITGSSDQSDVSTTCNIFSGEWVPNNDAPYYTNETCGAIHEHQNCMKHGRPDTGYLKWRWKPDGCELPVFDPAEFLELVRDKSLAFVGDSVARNHMQSLICLLSRVSK